MRRFESERGVHILHDRFLLDGNESTTVLEFAFDAQPRLTGDDPCHLFGARLHSVSRSAHAARAC